MTLKVFSPGYQAIEWGFDYNQVVDLATALDQPVRIASLPVMFDDPTGFAWKPEFDGLMLDQFDLVLFTDIEFRSQTVITDWIKKYNCENYLLCIGGIHPDQPDNPRVIYRPYWSFNFLKWNQPDPTYALQRPFTWECLHGARREHRDFVMLAFQQSNLLDQSIVNYRDIFMGHTNQEVSRRVQENFPGMVMQYPYVSPNLDPAWEVRGGNLDNTISSAIPWDIWNRCYYSILVETLGSGGCFFMSEKAGKCFFARRLFVHFGVQNYLAMVRKLGFETFNSIIDESYDSIADDIKRWNQAFEQVKFLTKQNPQQVLEKIKPVLDHNQNRLLKLKQELHDRMQLMIQSNLK